MDILREVMKRLLISAIKEKDVVRRDILRLVIADVEADHKRQDDDKWAETVIRKHLKQNEEALAFYEEGDEGHTRLKRQSGMLQSLLPETMTQEHIESFLLRCDAEEIQPILKAKSDGQAMGMAMKIFKVAGENVLGTDVKAVVDRLRG